jgi:hypothetical protein
MGAVILPSAVTKYQKTEKKEKKLQPHTQTLFLGTFTFLEQHLGLLLILLLTKCPVWDDHLYPIPLPQGALCLLVLTGSGHIVRGVGF